MQKIWRDSGQAVAEIAAAARPAGVASRTARLVVVLAVTVGVASVCWVIALHRMSGMNMGVSTRLGSFGTFTVSWLVMMAAMMLPGAAPAAMRRAVTSVRLPAPVVFGATYLAFWVCTGPVVYLLDRPHGTVVAGAAAIAAGGYELTPVKKHARRMCEVAVSSGWGFGLFCAESSAGLMVLMVAAGVMSVAWMAGIGLLVTAQKLMPSRAAIDAPVALALIGLGIVILVAPTAIPGLVPATASMRPM